MRGPSRLRVGTYRFIIVATVVGIVVGIIDFVLRRYLIAAATTTAAVLTLWLTFSQRQWFDRPTESLDAAKTMTRSFDTRMRLQLTVFGILVIFLGAGGLALSLWWMHRGSLEVAFLTGVPSALFIFFGSVGAVGLWLPKNRHGAA